jgi:LDH2 family malate/lactate/ureidoglycolate dehydrogenase
MSLRHRYPADPAAHWSELNAIRGWPCSAPWLIRAGSILTLLRDHSKVGTLIRSTRSKLVRACCARPAVGAFRSLIAPGAWRALRFLPMTSPLRYSAPSLVRFAYDLLTQAGLDAPIAADVATILVEGDLLGHTTHGLQLLSPYLCELDSGAMLRAGAPSVVARHTASEAWDGNRLPGPWLVLRALERAAAIARKHGTGTVSIRRSHHIACLGAYLKRATDQGLLIILTCSDPAIASVAPFGALTPVFTPNPIAAGLPTSGDPILLDISASLTTNGQINRLVQEGRRLPHPWVQDHRGNPTDDPGELFKEPKGTLLPTGGLDAGHKGYSLALLIEALTAGLSGHGRADPSEGWGATVFLQIFDPEAFGGLKQFARQMDWLAAACHAATPRVGVEKVRLPGERGLAQFRRQQQNGVELYPGIMDGLRTWSERLAVAPPQAL